MPRFGASMPSSQAKEAAKNVRAMIGLARDLAATNQSVTAIVIDANSNCLEIVDIGSNFNSQSKNDQMLIRRQYIGDKFEIKVPEGFQQIGDKKALIFRPDGRTQKGAIVLEENSENTAAKWEILIECDGTAILREILTK
jgi:Tfp pilus assembly protein FimT